MKLEEAEARLGINLPQEHRRAMHDPNDPIHESCDFLIPSSPYELLRWVEVNDILHAHDHWNRWPAFLVAFASNGCGDYFAYVLRGEPLRVIYMNPDSTVAENLSEGRLEYDSFSEWYTNRLSRRRVQPPGLDQA